MNWAGRLGGRNTGRASEDGPADAMVLAAVALASEEKHLNGPGFSVTLSQCPHPRQKSSG